MRALPLFHRVAGLAVIVRGDGPAAEAKRRLVERAGGEAVGDIFLGIAKGARLAFIAHEDVAADEAEAAQLRAAGVLVNVTDRPDLCDFTVPSVLDRNPVLVAVGTAGASAGLAKQLRLRLEAILPASLGALAEGLHAARGKLRERWPAAAERRRALDSALREGGALDPFAESSAEQVEAWLAAPDVSPATGAVEIVIASGDPDDLTLRQARLLGRADVVLHDAQVPPAILQRARADAVRGPLPHEGALPSGLVILLRSSDHNHSI